LCSKRIKHANVLLKWLSRLQRRNATIAWINIVKYVPIILCCVRPVWRLSPSREIPVFALKVRCCTLPQPLVKIVWIQIVRLVDRIDYAQFVKQDMN
jgi:hypothetical protein